jgi:hypothetical protein
MNRAVATAAALAFLLHPIPFSGPAAAAATGDYDAAASGDYDIVAGDQATGSLIRFAADAPDWSATPDWQWRPQAPDFSAADISAFRLVSDARLRTTPDGQERFLTTASYGLMAMLAYPGGERIWSQRVTVADNPHAIELLPDGNVAVAASSGGWVRVYPTAGGAPAEFRLPGAHAALWDPVLGRLWTVGDLPTGRTVDGADVVAPALIALEVYGPPGRPALREDLTRRVMLDAGTTASDHGHDVYADASRPNTLWITTNRAVFRYDTTTGRATQETGAAGRTFVKSVGVQPSGVVVQTRPDAAATPPGPCTTNSWCTSRVDLIAPDGTTTTRTRPGAAFYKARVWTPYSTAVDRPGRGRVLEGVRTPAGGWGSRQLDGNRAVAGVAAASGPDGRVHAFTVLPGSGVWQRTRDTAGAWAGSSTRIGGTADVSAAAAVVDAAGRTHLFTVVPGGGVQERVDGGPPRSVDADGLITRATATLGADGRLRLYTLAPGSGVSERTADGAGWSAATPVDRNGSITTVSAVTGADGRLRLYTVVPGSGVWERVHDGTAWPSSRRMLSTTAPGGSIADIGAVAATRAGDRLQVSVTRSGAGVETYRLPPGGDWTLERRDVAAANVLDLATAGRPDGGLHVLSVPEVG